MKLLAIDTSTEACSVAIRVDGRELVDHRVVPQQHGALLLPMIDALMADAGLSVNDLDALVYGRGPGSFTGVRIGVACAQGIALGADIGVVGVSTMQTIAQGVYREYGDTSVAVSVDARMDEVYFCEYAMGPDKLMQAQGDEQIRPPGQIAKVSDATHWAGSGAERYTAILVADYAVTEASIRHACLPQATDLLALGAHCVAQGNVLSAEHAQPVYLRNKVALTTAERAAR